MTLPEEESKALPPTEMAETVKPARKKRYKLTDEELLAQATALAEARKLGVVVPEPRKKQTLTVEQKAAGKEEARKRKFIALARSHETEASSVVGVEVGQKVENESNATQVASKDGETTPNTSAPEEDIRAKMAALEYLNTFAHSRSEWKFRKVRQTWILQNLYFPSQLPDESFEVALLYLADLKGAAREETLLEAKEYRKEYERFKSDPVAFQQSMLMTADTSSTDAPLPPSPLPSATCHMIRETGRRAKKIVKVLKSS